MTDQPDYMPREGVNGFSLKQSPTSLVDSALQVYSRCFTYPDSRSLHEAAQAYRKELIRIVTENALLRDTLKKCRSHIPSHGTHAEDLINEVESRIAGWHPEEIKVPTPD